MLLGLKRPFDWYLPLLYPLPSRETVPLSTIFVVSRKYIQISFPYHLPESRHGHMADNFESTHVGHKEWVSLWVGWLELRSSMRRMSLRVPSKKVLNRSPILATLLRPLAYINLFSYGSLPTVVSKYSSPILTIMLRPLAYINLFSYGSLPTVVSKYSSPILAIMLMVSKPCLAFCTQLFCDM